MSASSGTTPHGMMKGTAMAMKVACDGHRDGSQTMGHRPVAKLGSAEAPHVAAQRSFGRLFDHQADQPDPDAISELAARMVEGPDDAVDGPADAGTAFFGQFIDHDLTLDATTQLGEAARRVEEIENFRTPRFDLDSVYGSGPEVDPWLYGQQDEGRGLAFGRGWAAGTQGNPLDLQRNCNDRALIGDPRNDENLFISQIHGRQFVAEHNRLLGEASGTVEHRYEVAREGLTHAYQRRILHEFLPAVVDQSVLDPLVQGAMDGNLPGPISWDCAPDMPVEFAAAAFRFGHSMIRQTYALNDAHEEEDIFSPVNAGFSPVARAHNLDMARFFGPQAQRSRPINTKIAADLISLPTNIVGRMPGLSEAEDAKARNLADRNMQRGQHTFHLPTGETVAQAMGVDVLDPHPDVADLGLTGMTPLWFYILWEAENTGGRLGAVGGMLVAGTILNLMLRDKMSILHTEEAARAVA
ncbi:peroxidase family protein [Jannaschia donghaensis]|uniref:Animal haem peroxidase n=1 Tax=Jannaschia donghaensis TaxID=420998 RepID=A0A0M6YJN8_9RHOB|nr:peroxidase family protein [Jannaschia donghaensis]CTQ50134.1 Animal haem peroxidase [Jannaschia donghaensis]